MGPIQSLDELLSMLRRRAPIIAAITFLGLVAGIVVALSTPPVFSSSAIIQVEVSNVSDELAQSTVAGSAARRVQQIEQRIMARDNLLEIADAFGLFTAFTESPLERTQFMRESITVESIAAVQQGFTSDGAVSALMIMVDFDNAQVAADLANELANSVVSQSLEARSGRATETLIFFRIEDTRISEELAQLDSEISLFKMANDDALPVNVEARREELARLEESLLDVERELVTLRAEMTSLETSGSRGAGQRRLLQLIDQINALEDERALISDRIQTLEPLFQRAPEVERLLSGLEREQRQLQEQLGVITTRLAQAAIGARLEIDQQAERFDLLEEAVPAQYPVSRSRKTLVLMALAGAAGVGLLLGFLLELMNPVLRTPGQMLRELDLLPIMTIPNIPAAAEKRRAYLGWVAGGILVALSALALLLRNNVP
jgi:tyrosine-protein kinase Etk/Wzc